jgi:hypothetical protein
MDTNEAWRNGYTDGYQEIKGVRPQIPARPGSVPVGAANQVDYFYQLGYRIGKEAALKK